MAQNKVAKFIFTLYAMQLTHNIEKARVTHGP